MAHCVNSRARRGLRSLGLMLVPLLLRALLREVGCGVGAVSGAAVATAGGAARRARARAATLRLVEPLDTQGFGSGQAGALPGLAQRVAAWQAAPHGLRLERAAQWAAQIEARDELDVSRDELVRLVLLEFRAQGALGSEVVSHVSAALKALHRLRLLSACTSISRERDVRVELTTQAVDPASQEGPYIFVYRLRISNNAPGPCKVQLVGRHWIFSNAAGQEEAVVQRFADGVVGQKPILCSPAAATDASQPLAFQYMSGTQLSTRTGEVRGSFLFEDLGTGDLFEVPITPTPLRS